MTNELPKKRDTLSLEHRLTVSEITASRRWNTDFFHLQSGGPILVVSHRPGIIRRDSAPAGVMSPPDMVQPVMALAIKRSHSFFSAKPSDIQLIVAIHAEESDGQNVVVNDHSIHFNLETDAPQFFFGVEQISAWVFDGLDKKDEQSWKFKADVLLRLAKLAAALNYEFKAFPELNKVVGDHIGELIFTLVRLFKMPTADGLTDVASARIFGELKSLGRSPESISRAMKMVLSAQVDKCIGDLSMER